MSGSSRDIVDLHGREGKALYDAWKKTQPSAGHTMHCPLTTVRTCRFHEAGEGAEFALPLPFKLLCLLLNREFPEKHDIAPWTSETSLREFDCRCWWLGISCLQGLTLRAHDWRENSFLWP